MELAYSGGRCEVSCEGEGVGGGVQGQRRHRGSWWINNRLFGLRQESPGAAQQSEEETSLC